MARVKKIPVKLLLPKNIGAMQISNDLTLIERKIMNIILWNSFNIERDNFINERSFNRDNKKYYKIGITVVEDILGYGSNNRMELKKSFSKLVETSLQFNILKKQNTDNNKWDTVASLLSHVTFDEEKNEMHYTFSEPIKDIIIKPTLYGWINLEEQKSINSKYSLALIEYLQGSIAITTRTKTRTEYIALDDYTKLIAGHKCNYDTFKHINQKLIKFPLKEVNDKSNITAKASFQKMGKKVVGISFDIEKNDVIVHNNNLELDFNSDNNTIINDNIQTNTATQTQEEQQVSELMILYDISERKRREYLKTYSPTYIKANISYLCKQPKWKDKKLPPALLIKAIEDNYDNYGEEKEVMNLKKNYIFELREILNPFIDKTGREFLRNIISDYQIHKDRKNNAEIQQSALLLKQSFKRIDFLKQELLKCGFDDEESILFEIGIKTDDDYSRIFFRSKEEINEIKEEICY
jgi:plasmid replication initiation protein